MDLTEDIRRQGPSRRRRGVRFKMSLVRGSQTKGCARRMTHGESKHQPYRGLAYLSSNFVEFRPVPPIPSIREEASPSRWEALDLMGRRVRGTSRPSADQNAGPSARRRDDASVVVPLEHRIRELNHIEVLVGDVVRGVGQR